MLNLHGLKVPDQFKQSQFVILCPTILLSCTRKKPIWNREGHYLFFPVLLQLLFSIALTFFWNHVSTNISKEYITKFALSNNKPRLQLLTVCNHFTLLYHQLGTIWEMCHLYINVLHWQLKFSLHIKGISLISVPIVKKMEKDTIHNRMNSKKVPNNFSVNICFNNWAWNDDDGVVASIKCNYSCKYIVPGFLSNVYFH